MQPLYEKYRPRDFGEVVGQDRAISVLKRLGTLGGRAFYLAGPSGSGKTTIARLIAAEVADPFNIEEIDATDLSAAAIRDIERSSYCYGLGDRNGRAFIVNEAHGLHAPAIRQLLTTLERIPGHVAWCLTTTDDGDAKLFDDIDASPLLSRCIELPMSRRPGSRLIAEKLLEVAREMGLDGQPIEFYVNLVKQRRNNWRSCYQFIESGGALAVEVAT